MLSIKQEKIKLLSKSYSLFASGNNEECIVILKQVLQLDPLSYQAYYMFSLIYENSEKELPFLLMACYLKKHDINLWIKAYFLTNDTNQKIEILTQIYKISESYTKKEILCELLKLYIKNNDKFNIYKIHLKTLRFIGELKNTVIKNLFNELINFSSNKQKTFCKLLFKEIINYKININLENRINLIYFLFKANEFQSVIYLQFESKDELIMDIFNLSGIICGNSNNLFRSKFKELELIYIDYLIANKMYDKSKEYLSNRIINTNLEITDQIDNINRNFNNYKNNDGLKMLFRYKKPLFSKKYLNKLILIFTFRNTTHKERLLIRLACINYLLNEINYLDIFTNLYSKHPNILILQRILGRENKKVLNTEEEFIKRFIKGKDFCDKYICTVVNEDYEDEHEKWLCKGMFNVDVSKPILSNNNTKYINNSIKNAENELLDNANFILNLSNNTPIVNNTIIFGSFNNIPNTGNTNNIPNTGSTNNVPNTGNSISRKNRQLLWNIPTYKLFIFLINYINKSSDSETLIKIIKSNNINYLEIKQRNFIFLFTLKKALSDKNYKLILVCCSKLNKNYNLIYYLLSIYNIDYFNREFYATQKQFKKHCLRVELTSSNPTDVNPTDVNPTDNTLINNIISNNNCSIYNKNIGNKNNNISNNCVVNNNKEEYYFSSFMPNYLFSNTIEDLLKYKSDSEYLIPIFITHLLSRSVKNKELIINRVNSITQSKYNRGRVFQFLGLISKAIEVYKGNRDIYSIYNLALLYKKNNSKLQYKVMISKYRKIFYQ